MVGNVVVLDLRIVLTRRYLVVPGSTRLFRVGVVTGVGMLALF
jgi:hypothetical protein